MSNPKRIWAPMLGFALLILSVVPAVVQAEPPAPAGIILIREPITLVNIKERVADAFIQQELTTSVINMKNATNRNAAGPRRTFPHWHLGVYLAGVAGDHGGLGVGGEAGVSYVTPTYAVGFQLRETAVTAIFSSTDIWSASIGGLVFLNRYISPYMGGGFSMNEINESAWTTWDTTEEKSSVGPGVYGVVGIEVPHFSKHRFKLEMRVDRIIPELTSVTLGVFFSTTIF